MLDAAEFKESKHPRGQPGNSGQFAAAPGGGKKSTEGAEGGGDPGAGEGGKEGKVSPTKIAPRAKQIDAAVDLAKYLRMVSGARKRGGGKSAEGKKTPEQFILESGHPYVVNPKTYEGPRDPMHECYRNATLATLKNKDRTYVEGYITVHGVPVEHAWTVDEKGQVYDSTISPDMNIGGYFGVPFKRDYVLASGLVNKKYGLLGQESSKTLQPLLAGKVTDYKTQADPQKLAPSAIADRIAYADALVRTIPPTDKINTEERLALRKQIADSVYNKDIDKRSRNREATIILGLPGAGKSTFAEPLLQKGALEIDPDLVKPQLPEYDNGIGAFAVHEESSAITRGVLEKAMTNGDDFVWPRIDSPEKMLADLKSLKDAGYKVNIKYIDVDPAVALQNAVNRFVKTGRYVSMETIKSYGDSPRTAYEAVLKSGMVDGHESYKSVYGKGFEKQS